MRLMRAFTAGALSLWMLLAVSERQKDLTPREEAKNDSSENSPRPLTPLAPVISATLVDNVTAATKVARDYQLHRDDNVHLCASLFSRAIRVPTEGRPYNFVKLGQYLFSDKFINRLRKL